MEDSELVWNKHDTIYKSKIDAHKGDSKYINNLILHNRVMMDVFKT
jgi:hypothetical protein